MLFSLLKIETKTNFSLYFFLKQMNSILYKHALKHFDRRCFQNSAVSEIFPKKMFQFIYQKINNSIKKRNCNRTSPFIHKSLLIFFAFLNFRFRIRKNMKGSVIGNSQAKICRSELTRRELGFRFGSDVISGEQGQLEMDLRDP